MKVVDGMKVEVLQPRSSGATRCRFCLEIECSEARGLRTVFWEFASKELPVHFKAVFVAADSEKQYEKVGSVASSVGPAALGPRVPASPASVRPVHLHGLWRNGGTESFVLRSVTDPPAGPGRLSRLQKGPFVGAVNSHILGKTGHFTPRQRGVLTLSWDNRSMRRSEELHHCVFESQARGPRGGRSTGFTTRRWGCVLPAFCWSATGLCLGSWLPCRHGHARLTRVDCVD